MSNLFLPPTIQEIGGRKTRKTRTSRRSRKHRKSIKNKKKPTKKYRSKRNNVKLPLSSSMMVVLA